ncbi:subtilisin-like serine protease pr1c [Colletotrichum plurivorum]|uniref:Subtilisin-like serine protease pr1c n=1 Tax=Colletotrichum plurivorum TaxID=2175906 RepID=A0A8H6N3X8_9PEZI|nr:subtilisin-like serine protease pr1c [Colletotrichum plurivorum]
MRSSSWVLPLVTFFTQTAAASGGDVFILEFSDAPPAEPLAAVEQGLLDAGLACTVSPRHTFDTPLFTGVSMLADCTTTKTPHTSVLDAMNSLAFVKKAWPALRDIKPAPPIVPGHQPADTLHHGAASPLPKRQSRNDTLFELDTMPTHVDTGVTKVHAQNVTGAVVRIAVIDSGFDLAAPGLSLTRVAYNYNYAESAENFSSNETCVPWLHGTHVLGIIAADSPERRFGIVGVAPEATVELHGLEACDGSDSGSLDTLMAAIVAADRRGVDMIMIGYAIPLAFEDEPMARIVSAVVANGTAVTVGSGNSGPGPFTGGSPAGAPGATAVGSSDNSATPYYTWRLNYTSPSDSGFLRFTPSLPSDFPRGNNLTLWMPASPEGLPAGCNPAPADFTPPADPANTIMLIDEEHCWLDPKNTSNRLALALGVPYVLRYQPASTTVADGMQWVPRFAEFSRQYKGIARVTNDDATYLKSLLSAGQVTLSVPGRLEDDAHEEVLYRENDLSGGLATFFSSWGPTVEGRSYPSFLAPGENILSTFLHRYGGVAVVGGTSMSNPFAVGVYALVKQRHPEYTPNDLLSVVASTAKPLQFVDARRQKFDYLAPVFQQGGGLVDAFAAVNTPSLVNVSSLDFNDTANRPSVLTFTLKNTGSESIDYTLGHIGAASGYILSASGAYTLAGDDTLPIYADVDITPSSLTLSPGASAEVSVSIRSDPSLPDADRRGVYFGGYISITPSTPSANLTLPYTGFATPLTSVPMINPESSYLVTVDPATNIDTRLEPDAVVTCLYNASIPLPDWPVDCEPGWPGFRRLFVTQSRNFTYDLVDAATGEDILPSTFASNPNEYFSPSTWWVWNGSEEDRKFIPAGSYFWRLRALRLNGDAGREAHWDTWESGNWTLAYSPESVGLPSGTA